MTMVSNHNLETKGFEKGFRSNLENKLSTLELTKQSFFFLCKKHA